MSTVKAVTDSEREELMLLREVMQDLAEVIQYHTANEVSADYVVGWVGAVLRRAGAELSK
jgi:hypothetical protein